MFVPRMARMCVYVCTRECIQLYCKQSSAAHTLIIRKTKQRVLEFGKGNNFRGICRVLAH